MPIYRANSKLILFSHVPKCGGTSVKAYLDARLGSPALDDRGYLRSPETVPWNQTSPQHIDARSLSRVFPANFFDARFAVVRHPVKRIASVYLYQRYKERKIPKWMTFGLWLRTLEWTLKNRPFAYDNHIRPQVDFLDEDTRVFRLEDGMEDIEQYLHDLLGHVGAGLAIGKANVSKRRLEVSAANETHIRRIYRRDFEELGYE